MNKTHDIEEFSLKLVLYRGLDNKLTLYPLNTDDDASKQKRVVGTHANYISACKFMHSDQQVRFDSFSIDSINKYF